MSRQTEEENAVLEKLQQEITLTLQAIDENFARCTQIVSQGIIPELEAYSTGSKRVWEGLKVWMYFFQHVEKSTIKPQHKTNRPPFPQYTPESASDLTPWDRLKDKFSPSSQDISRLLQRPPLTHTTATSATLARPHPLPTLPSFASSNSTGDSSSTASFRRRTSPPITIPLPISSRDLLNTPAREAAHIMVENRLRRIGVESSPSDSEEGDESFHHKRQQQQEEEEQRNYQGDETPASWKANGNYEGEAVFQGFMRSREKRYQNMDPDAELPIIRNRPIPKSPGHQEGQDLTSFLTANYSLASSPVASFNQDLRPPSKRTRDTMMLDDDIGSILPLSTTTRNNQGPYNVQQNNNDGDDDDDDEDMDITGAYNFSHIRTNDIATTPNNQDPLNVQQNNDDEDMDITGAYEFSQIRPYDIVAPLTDEGRESRIGTPLGSVGGLSVASTASQLPKKFSLHYFSSMYREPPASTQLTRIYTLFSDRAEQFQTDQSLLPEQVLELVQDNKSFTLERVKLFLSVLASKKFLKKSGGRYTLRQ